MVIWIGLEYGRGKEVFNLLKPDPQSGSAWELGREVTLNLNCGAPPLLWREKETGLYQPAASYCLKIKARKKVAKPGGSEG